MDYIPNWLVALGPDLPLIAMLLFMGISLVVVIYTLTDRRRGHDARMRGMALDAEQEPRHGR